MSSIYFSMLKRLLFVVFVGLGLTIARITYAAGLEVPKLIVSQDRETIALTWDPVPSAIKYEFYYAPFPSLSPISKLDLDDLTRIEAKFSDTEAYIVALAAYDVNEKVVFSNTPILQRNLKASGGETSLDVATSNAFALPAPNLSEDENLFHIEGDKAFDAVFVTAPSSVNSGLGPIFNHNSCASCHPKNGRDVGPDAGDVADTMLFRVSLPGAHKITGAPIGVPGFGLQIATKANFGIQPEATVTVSYNESKIILDSGIEVQLREPSFSIDSYIDLPGDSLFSARVGPPVFGRGLLEAITENSILALVDEYDSDSDGISGRPNYVWDHEKQKTVLGRFGLKANNPDLRLQTADAYHQDMGVTNSIFTSDTAFSQVQDDGLGDDPELDEDTFNAAVFYVQSLAVPERRNVNDPEVQLGELVFAKAKCAVCHTPTFKTGKSEISDSLSNQVIHPWSDMLLHDMGPGLADNRPDFMANGREWRTSPLWGIGLTRLVNGHNTFLHDGRARTILEAIMWHGGEAQASRDYVFSTNENEVEALLKFLNSL